MATTIQESLSQKPKLQLTQRVEYVETVEAYDRWAEVYDTDGNFLQRLDSLEMHTLLPRFLDRVSARFQGQCQLTDPMTLVDLGCGTGRNTIQLLESISQVRKECQSNAFSIRNLHIVGLDASPGMLEVARAAVQPIESTGFPNTVNISLGVFDLLKFASMRSQLPSVLQNAGAVGVISTLVLEHLPLKEFFGAASAIMLPGAYLLVTNMHPDMGTKSQAGFTDPQTGVKIRPTSYCHSVEAVLAIADQMGFQIEDIIGEEGEGGVLVRDVNEQLAEVLGVRANKWVGTKAWFGVCLSKRV